MGLSKKLRLRFSIYFHVSRLFVSVTTVYPCICDYFHLSYSLPFCPSSIIPSVYK